MRIRLGTRQSPLARWQAEFIASQLERLGTEVEMVPIVTSGDVKVGPLGEGGGVGLFTKEIQRALLDRRCDLAVHSLKDLPTDEVPGLCLAAVPEREEVADGLIARNGLTFESLPKGARIGTGSARRIAQLRMHRPDLKMLDIRGNVDTRLKKLEAGEYDAIVLAIAGLKRLGLADCVTEQLDLRLMLPAVGQAALGLETRHDDSDVIEVVERLNHPPTYQAVIAERSMLRALRGGCIAPVAAHAIVSGANITLQSRVLAMDGTSRVETTLAGPSKAPDAIGLRAAELLELGGAREMIAASRKID